MAEHTVRVESQLEIQRPIGEVYGVMRLMRPIAAWMANQERSRTLSSLKRSFE